MSEVSKQNYLQVVSYLAPNWFDFYQAVVAYLSRVLGIETQLHQGEYDPLEDPLLLQDQLDLAFICGLPLIRRWQLAPKLQPLVAPVMISARYQQRPIYYSDVIVNANSDLVKFEDLAGKTFCYNDLGSNSGYNLLRYKLIQSGYSQSFFGETIQSGSHQNSIRWVVDGIADCAAIDSVVLEQERNNFPELSQQLRVVEALGPSPAPPLAYSWHLDKSLVEQIRLALLHPDTQLQAAMDKYRVKSFATVELEDYFGLARMYHY
ncbi:ABC-type phosphate/phosphonate transport system periplasmic component-like protein [Calothrix sp. NIES-4071]|nr:ABC-type phosphate/phosphonate transport system periplasmic component-like protein [Calothrix sp. NIES-4071]BAZ56111.1 ABC-type phosphate/phosphonate transport system periplasmic component-like protein [Calothrix sp. NIES-4105]